MLKGLKDRLLNISSSAKRITVSALTKTKTKILEFLSSAKTITTKTLQRSKETLQNLSSTSKQYIVLTVASVAVLATVVGIGFSMSKTVVIVDGNNAEKEVITFNRYVDDVLEAENIELGEYDKLSVAADSELKDNMRIEIQRAFMVSVTENGVTKEHMAVGKTAGEVLNGLGYNVKETDKLTPAFNESVAGVENILVVRTEEKIMKITEDIPFETTERTNAALALGRTKVIQEGEPGEKSISYKVYYEDGVEVSREKISEEVVTPAIEKITEIGTKRSSSSPNVIAAAGTIQTSRSGNLAYSKVITLNATAYDASSCGKSPSHPAYGITATGRRAGYGIVAVDPNVIPLGSTLYIETADGSYVYGHAIAADTGGAIKGNRIDLCYDTRQEALNFGRRQVKVYVLN